MDWDAEVTRARRLKEEAARAELAEADAAASAAAAEAARWDELCDALDAVRNALVRADWPAAGWFRPAFHTYGTLLRTIRGQTYVTMRVTEIAEVVYGEGTGGVEQIAEITYYKHPDIYSGNLIRVTAGLAGPMRDERELRKIKFIGTYLYRLTPELVIRAAARYCGEHRVDLDLRSLLT
jgi:hypothetical protein